MADDQVGHAILFLQRRLQLPHLYAADPVYSLDPAATILRAEAGTVEVRLATLDDEGCVSACTKDIDDGLGEGFLDESVEARGADGDKDTHGEGSG